MHTQCTFWHLLITSLLFLSCLGTTTAQTDAEAELRNSLMDNYDITYHYMVLRIDPKDRFISGSVQTNFLVTQDSMKSIYFDMDEALGITTIILDGSYLLSEERVSESIIRIDFPMTLYDDRPHAIEISYAGTPPEGDDRGLVQSEHDGTPIIWTLSEPYSASDWWPCKENLNDKIDSMDILLIVPRGQVAASNGVLVDEYDFGPTTRFLWKHRYPIASYLVGVAVTNYARYTDYAIVEGDSVPIYNYVYPEDLEEAQLKLKVTVPQIELFSELFGPYPFKEEKYGNAQFGFGGGMEHQTMSFMGSFSVDLQAHELAHQWFGNKVTCGSWRDLWLNEGWATYATGLYHEKSGDIDTWERWKNSTKNEALQAIKGSVYAYDTTDRWELFDSPLRYSKGAYVLHMLRWMVGEEAFFNATRSYLNDELLAYGYATTEDLRHHMEVASGRDLSDFFDDWVYGGGNPSYLVSWRQSREDSNKYSFAISQKLSHGGEGFIEMDLPIQFKGAGGRDSIIRVVHAHDFQEYSIKLDFQVEEVVFDPHQWILSARNKVEKATLLSDKVIIYPNPVADFLTIETLNIFAEPIIATLYNMNGKECLASEVYSNQIKLDVNELPSGVYILRLVSGKNVKTHKVVIK